MRSRARDVDRDGDKDLLLVFSVCDLVADDALDESSTQLFLTGETFEGIEGSDWVLTVLDDDGDDD